MGHGGAPRGTETQHMTHVRARAVRLARMLARVRCIAICTDVFGHVARVGHVIELPYLAMPIYELCCM